ncbi:MAG TPA: dienelactone hydrolase family protein [Caulobacteraceae bacterium]|jgi:dienelactone hydrolase
MAERWAWLEPAVHVYGPDHGEPRPAVLLFHGCGGVRKHNHRYAREIAGLGFRVFVVDSYRPRRWPHTLTRIAVCTGLMFWGRERAGDVLAAVWGVTRRPEVDASRLALVGWSHGAWSIMDLMTMPLTTSGEADLDDPDPEPLAGVRGLFLAYPYGGFAALSHKRKWLRAPKVFGAVAHRDHVTPLRTARTLFEGVRSVCADLEMWEVEGATHSFDEVTGIFPMRYDEALSVQAIERCRRFLQGVLA